MTRYLGRSLNVFHVDEAIANAHHIHQKTERRDRLHQATALFDYFTRLVVCLLSSDISLIEFMVF